MSPKEVSFMAEPGQVADWRLALLYDRLATAGVLDRLPSGANEAAAGLELDIHAVGVLLDALSTWGVVAREGDGTYRAGPSWPDPGESAQLRHHARAIDRWSTSLAPRLAPPGATGGVAPATAGPSGAPTDPKLFVEALGAGARSQAPPVVDRCLARFPDARRVLDLGGGHGEYSLEMARRGMSVVLQDRPVMIDVVREEARLEEAGVELFAGDFFDVLPGGPFDLVFCSGVTHTFGPESNAALYPRLREIVAPGGGLAVVTFLRGRNSRSAIFAVQMLVNGNGGDTHGEHDYRRWLSDAGFGHVGVEDLEPLAQSLLWARA